MLPYLSINLRAPKLLCRYLRLQIFTVGESRSWLDLDLSSGKRLFTFVWQCTTTNKNSHDQLCPITQQFIVSACSLGLETTNIPLLQMTYKRAWFHFIVSLYSLNMLSPCLFFEASNLTSIHLTW
ncbi:hypothetical protein RF11_16361 [Thelohanellus kitauei]|uniref:Uncharacterized protein n=1 Tax=Thelohanellus kitauei TaxID=669202 RepID=A0A0C2MGU6_THEKT|nr:hypothetical protein RF11_16361 [Thelohanellus kitauei]